MLGIFIVGNHEVLTDTTENFNSSFRVAISLKRTVFLVNDLGGEIFICIS